MLDINFTCEMSASLDKWTLVLVDCTKGNDLIFANSMPERHAKHASFLH